MSDNSYDYMQVGTSRSVSDVSERQWLAQCIRDFANGSGPADEEIGNLYKLSDNSEDPVVRHVSEQFAYLQHLGSGIEKRDWDGLQRLLLLCESQHSLRPSIPTYKRNLGQLYAALAGIVLLVVGILGNWLEFMAASFVANAVGFALFSWPTKVPGRAQIALTPFETICDLKTVYTETGFRKQRYPYSSSPQQSEPTRLSRLLLIICISCIPVAPLLLFLLPDSEQTVTVVLDKATLGPEAA